MKKLSKNVLIQEMYILKQYMSCSIYHCYGLASVVVRRAVTSSYKGLLGQSKSNLVCNIYRVKRQGIVNFVNSHHNREVIMGEVVKIDVFL